MNIAEAFGLDRTEPLKDVEWNGQPLLITYKPVMLETPIVQQGLADGLSTRPMGLAEALAELLGEWDIDWNGEEYPPTVYNLARLPKEFLMYLIEKMLPEEKAEAANG